jgi:hypothetical protein
MGCFSSGRKTFESVGCFKKGAQFVDRLLYDLYNGSILSIVSPVMPANPNIVRMVSVSIRGQVELWDWDEDGAATAWRNDNALVNQDIKHTFEKGGEHSDGSSSNARSTFQQNPIRTTEQSHDLSSWILMGLFQTITTQLSCINMIDRDFLCCGSEDGRVELWTWPLLEVSMTTTMGKHPMMHPFERSGLLHPIKRKMIKPILHVERKAHAATIIDILVFSDHMDDDNDVCVLPLHANV